jgi:hypothetical protein
MEVFLKKYTGCAWERIQKKEIIVFSSVDKEPQSTNKGR